MVTEKTKVFFKEFENNINNFRPELLASLYADVFMFGSPGGIQSIKKEDFLKILPRRKDIIVKRGLISSTIISLKETRLNDQYTIVKAVWKMCYRKPTDDIIEGINTSTYVLFGDDVSLKIVTQIDHQDLMEN